jgi:response regulator RpfG family c-di-GMP phosphodiesterase
MNHSSENGRHAARMSLPSLAVAYLVLMIGESNVRFERYRARLQAGGFSVIATREAGDGPRLIAAVRPAVCIIDVCSLHQQGWELCERIHVLPSLRSIPIMVLADTAGYPRRALKTHAHRLRCTIFAMPLTSNDFVDCVATLIGCGRPC